jgi:hypothetical protein
VPDGLAAAGRWSGGARLAASPRRGCCAPWRRQELRLRHQAGRLAAGAAADDTVALDELGALQRRWLKDAAHLLQTCQEHVRTRFRTDQIG